MTRESTLRPNEIQPDTIDSLASKVEPQCWGYAIPHQQQMREQYKTDKSQTEEQDKVLKQK